MTLILASQSASRRAMLDAAGISYDAIPAYLDERGLEDSLHGSPPELIALALAEAKGLAVSAERPDALVLGSDSLVAVAGRRFNKPESRKQAAEHLRLFSGKEMQLCSAAALVRQGKVLWSHVALARLHVRELSEEFIADYLHHEWPAVSGCVGVFRIEARGVQLFSRIEGDHFTVLGMPLLAVLDGLRKLGELPA